MRPGGGSGVPSLAIVERLVGNFTQRLPLEVTIDGRAGVLRPAVGHDRLDDDLRCRTGTCSTSHWRVRLRVSSRDSTRPLCRLYTSPCPHSATVASARKVGRSAGARREAQSASSSIAVGGQQADDREDRHQPAAEEALLRAHEQDEQDRRRRQHPHQPALVVPQRRSSADRREQRDPPDPPGERPQVVDDAVVLREAELAQRVVGDRRLVVEPVAERAEVQQRVRVGDQEAGDRGAERDQRAAAGRQVAAGRQELRGDRRHQRQDHDPAGVLRGGGQAEPEAGDQVVAVAPEAQDSRGAPERQADRRQRRHVVERQVRVEDRQERDGEQPGRQDPHAAVEQALAGQVQQPDRERPHDRRRDARDDEDLGGVGRVGLVDAVAAAEPHREDDVQQVRVGRRVDEVVRVPAVPEQADRLGDEVRVLIRVVGVGQPVLDPPDAQDERAERAAPRRRAPSGGRGRPATPRRPGSAGLLRLGARARSRQQRT